MLQARVEGGQKFILVTGLARSGTTIVASVLNSCNNAVILSEPHNALLAGQKVRCEKIPQRDDLKVGDLCRWVKDSYFPLVGVKEVFQEKAETDDEPIHNYAERQADVMLIVLRDPVAVWASTKNFLTDHSFDRFLLRLRRFAVRTTLDHYFKPHKYRFIRYESFCLDPCGELNKVLRPQIMLEGILEKMPQLGMGDYHALICDKVHPPKGMKEGVSEEEKQAILAVTRGCPLWL